MTKQLGLVAFVLGAVTLGGCLLVTDLDELRDAEAVARLDGGAVNDGGGGDRGDGGDGGDSAPQARFCEAFTNSLFCDDFDQGEVGDLWNMSSADAQGAELTLDSSTATSSPRSLRAKVVNSGGGAFLRKELASRPAAKHTLSFQIRIEQRPGDATAGVFRFAPSLASLNNHFRLGIGAGGSYIEEVVTVGTSEPVYIPHYLSDDIPTKKWVPIVIDYVTSPPAITVTVAGNQVLVDEKLDPAMVEGESVIDLGLLFTDQAKTWDVRYDDIHYE